jgi:hypothetical protein
VILVKKTVIYYSEKGSANTEETLKLAHDRAKELGITDIVVATTHGSTGLKAAEIFKEPIFNLVAVSICEGWKEEGWPMTAEEKRKLLEKKIKVHTGIHALGDDVSSAFTGKMGGISTNEVVRETLYRFCQGMKVCVEIALMAADAGLIPLNKEVIAIGGTSEGADTAIVLNSACSRKFLDLKVKEIIAKPREG